MIPGVTNLPLRSATVAPAGLGIFDDGPMSRMRPFCITIVTSLWGSAPVPSMTVAWLSTVTCAVAAPVNNSTAARIKRVFAPFIWIPPPLETVSQLTRAGQKKNSFEKQKHNSIEQRYAKVRGKERGSDGVPIRESRAVRAVTGEYRRLREPGRSSTGL